ncbi:hypothetical protein NECAME_10035 [Necator americanus]|uniref:Uncharacterized protein n=1 Tax=Necator americanus TaxID=51031 RepID=W2TB45_NECAM|nr:hypothetical protein NECAME_10035 [Necator americanus]ETN79088.1 hypothetical protein NECAME_10035 [Necator americanus]
MMEEQEGKGSKEKGTKMVKDDESDRKKLAALRHAADSESEEDKAIDGAYTPDKICAVGPAGVAVLIEIEKVDTGEVGPRAKVGDKPMRGILVKGAHETPQFIPMEKVAKDSNGRPKYRNFTVGELVRGPHGEAIFYADGQCQCDKNGNPKNMNIAGVEPNLQKRIGETTCPPCEVEINEKGMPVLRQIACAEDVPKDKNAAVGVITKNKDGNNVFTQSAGQRLGSSDNAPCVPSTPGDKVAPGGLIGRVVEDKQGNTVVLPPGSKPTSDQTVTALVLQGTYHEPVYVKDIKRCECPPPANVPVVAAVEKEEKHNYQNIEKADTIVQAKVQNKTCDQIIAERKELKAAKPIYTGDVYSQSLYQEGGRGAAQKSVFLRTDLQAPPQGGNAGPQPVAQSGGGGAQPPQPSSARPGAPGGSGGSGGSGASGAAAAPHAHAPGGRSCTCSKKCPQGTQPPPTKPGGANGANGAGAGGAGAGGAGAGGAGAGGAGAGGAGVQPPKVIDQTERLCFFV